MRTFAIAEVKAVSDGQFEAILSTPTLDRDGEIIDVGAFAPLPESIPVHAFHDFSDPIGRGVPTYRDDVLVLSGTFATTPRAQEIRTLVKEGVIGAMSVGFMAATRDTQEDGITHITKAELLEGSFVSIPSNRDAAVLVAKSGARNNAADVDRLQQIHDLAVTNGASCEGKSHDAEGWVYVTPFTDSTNTSSAWTITNNSKSAATDPESDAAANAAADAPADVGTLVARAIASAAEVV